MADPRRVEAPTSTMRQRFRESLRDAVDGVDVTELQTGQRQATPPRQPTAGPSRSVLVHPAEAPARTLPARPAAPWNPGRAMAPVRPASAGTEADPQAALVQAQIDAALYPLRAEVAALRAEVARLRSLPAELSGLRRADMLTVAGLLVVTFVAAALVVGVILRI